MKKIYKHIYENYRSIALVLCLLVSLPSFSQRQKVGVVLSGGGATAAAHIGFLKALEEHDIPIDYITGSSMGAILGAFYAAGYTVEEIEAIVLSKDFLVMSKGEIPDSLSFYLREPENDASIINVKFNPNSIIESTLPTHLVDPVLMDYKFIGMFGPASAAAGYDFDSLYIPYRAVASDIEVNESVIFKEGELNLAARASGTFPFYLEPLEVDGKLLFDGGLYNNYPADVLYTEFSPDIIIGCNVSQNQGKPDVDNLMSQLINMIQYNTNFDNVCDEMITIEPSLSVKTFDFENADTAIRSGYKSTISKMDSILAIVDARISSEDRAAKRLKFKAKQQEILIKDVNISGLPDSRKSGIERLILKDKPYITMSEFEKSFFRLYADDKVRYAYPTLQLDKTDGKYIVTVHVRPERKMEVGFGGNFSSRPINMGFVQLKYRVPSRNSICLSANSYFGKFYSSTKAGVKFDLNLRSPIIVDANVTYNSWDYYNSFATFLEQVKPSFIIKNEEFVDLNFTLPIGNRGRFTLSNKYAHLYDDYYQTTDFSSTDTTDQTHFNAFIFGAEYKRSTLNHKQFSDKGTLLNFKYRFITGDEETIPGSTSEVRDTSMANHSWHFLKAQYTNYFYRKKRFRAGFNLESAISNQPRFNNYRATLIRSFAFEPIPESRSFFIDQYRSSFYSSAGLILNYNLAKNVGIRTESHVYRPWERIFDTPNDQGDFDPSTELFFIGSGSLIYQSPLGPIRVTVNYYDRKDVPWSVMFNFGYFIFNKGALD